MVSLQQEVIMTGTLWGVARLSLRDGITRLLFVLVALAAFAGTAMAQNPVPLINQPLVPDAIAPASRPLGFTLRVNGTGFVPSSVVYWNGSPRPTTYVSNSRLKAKIQALDFLRPGTASITVVSPGPGGGTSNVVFFEVTVNAALMAVGAPFDFATGYQQPQSNPTSVVTGDFNGDGKLDLAATNYNHSDVGILLGNGDGTFGPVATYAAGSYPLSVAVGDFNADGKLDLAVACNNQSNSVNILLGNGDGTFQRAVSYTAGSVSVSVAAGDFNADGKLDLVVANAQSNDVSILLGNGNGTFQTAVSYGVGSGPQSVAVGDFNADGKPDLAVANLDSNDVSILLGNGDGTFHTAVSYGAGSGPRSVAIGDFNADGKLDLAVANFNSADVSILLGNGDGTFQTAVSYSAGPGGALSVAVGDFNADNVPDLAVANFYSGNLGVLLGNGDGTFQTAVSYGAGSGPRSVAVGDFNRDGKLDMVVAYGGTGSVLLQNSLRFATQLVGTSSAPQPVTLSNTTGLPVNISSIVISGTNGSDFGQTNDCGSSLPAGGTCIINVTFTPSQLGPRTASVTTTYDGRGSPLVVNLRGKGTVVKLDPPRLEFGKVLVIPLSWMGEPLGAVQEANPCHSARRIVNPLCLKSRLQALVFATRYRGTPGPVPRLCPNS
jgi:hypothetical protein